MMQSHRLSRSLLSVAGSLLGFFWLIPSASALTVSPVLIDQPADPGFFTAGNIRLINDSGEKQTYYASVQNFIPSGEDGQQQFLPEKDTSGLVQWIKFEKTSVDLEPGETKEFQWTLSVPQKADPGGHYAAVFFSTLPGSAEGSAVGVGAKTGVLFLVNVSGDVKESAKVESFRAVTQDSSGRTEAPSYFNRKPVSFETRVRNVGNVHIKPEGKIKISNMLGVSVGEVPMNPGEGKALPNSIRRLVSPWGDATLVQEPGFLGGLKAEWEGFAIGKYTAKLDGTYGKTKQTLTAEVAFWVLPWRILVVVGVLLVLLLVLLKGYNMMIARSAVKKYKGGS